MTKALFISYDGLTDQLGQSQIIPYLVGLSKKGYKIHIISCEKRHVFEKNKSYINQILGKENIEWHPINYHKFPPIISTLLDVYNLKRKTQQLHKKYDFQILHCRSYIASIVGAWMKKKHSISFIFDMRGFWADERVDGKLWNLNNPIYRRIYNFFKKKEKQFLHNADYTISLTNNGKQILESGKLGYTIQSPVEVIPCCVDLNLFSASNTIENKDNDNFILSYLGSIGTWYMLDEMLDFFKVLKSKISNAQFLFITKEPKEIILNICDKKEIDKENIIIRSAERREIPDLIKQSDASIFFIKPVFSKKASSPTKQAETMAMGIPIICNSGVGDTDHIINDYKSGVIINNFNQTEYEKVVDVLLSSNFNTKDIIKGANEFYSLDLGIKKYAEVYKKCLN